MEHVLANHDVNITLISYVEQVQFYLENEPIPDYKSLATEIFLKMGHTEINHLVDNLTVLFPKQYSCLLKEINRLAAFGNKEKSYFGFRAKIEDEFAISNKDARESLNTGDYIAFLISKYFYYSTSKNEIVAPVYNSVLDSIIIALKQRFLILKSELDTKEKIPIEKAIHVFFLYEKKVCKYPQKLDTNKP